MSSTANNVPSSYHEWSAWHIHIPHSQHTPFVCETLLPLFTKENVVDFFFLRYWQGGPHLRVRVPNIDEEFASAIELRLAQSIPPLDDTAREEYEKSLRLQGELASLEGEMISAAEPPGSILRRPYFPEIEKYGGPEAIGIAEKLFCATSREGAELLSATQGTNPREPIGEAIMVMSESIHGFGLSTPEAVYFLGRYENYWRKYVPEGYDHMWQDLYETLGEKVKHIVGTAFSSTFSGKESTWSTIYHRARDAWAPLLADSAESRRRHPTSTSETMMHALSNYLHTTNNRLGLTPATEAFVAHLMRRSLAEHSR